MSHNTFGHLFRVTTFGESHGLALGAIVDGCPPGVALTEADIQGFLDKRKPGQSRFTTQRREADEVKILSGVFTDADGRQVTTGTPIALVIENTDQRSKDYGEIANKYRPGHADYVYDAKYGIRDYRGGGRSSARETAARVAAGAVARKVDPRRDDPRRAGADRPAQDRPRPFRLGRGRPQSAVLPRRRHGASNGRTISTACARTAPPSAPWSRWWRKGVPVGWGAPLYGKLDADLAARHDVDQRREGRGDRRRLRGRRTLRRGQRR